MRVLCAAALAAVLVPSVAAAPPSLARTLDKILDAPPFDTALWALEVRGLTSGTVVYSRNATKSFVPASTLKVVTTAALLDALGPEARFRTTVETPAAVDAEGRLMGDVYLVGRGDPSLSRGFAVSPDSGFFGSLADAVAAAGIRRIEGRVLGHDGLFPGERRGPEWPWEDLVWWYGAEVSALTFADGSVNLKVMPGSRPGDPVTVETKPASSYYRLVVTATTGPATPKPELVLSRDFGSNLIRLGGTLPAGHAPVDLFVALENPALYAATVFGEVLASRGVIVAGGAGTTDAVLPGDIRTLAVHESPPLAEILKDVNKPSHNLRAEMLFRQLGVQANGVGSAEAAATAVEAFLHRLPVDTRGWRVRDGSGLSPADLVTARGLVELLVAMDRHPQAEAFKASLPVAGVDGTLKGRFRGTRAEGRVAAKTGTLRSTAGLAGYARPLRGEPLAFVVLLNHHTEEGRVANAVLDAVIEALIKR